MAKESLIAVLTEGGNLPRQRDAQRPAAAAEEGAFERKNTKEKKKTF